MGEVPPQGSIRFKGSRRPGKWWLEDMLAMFPNLANRADTAAGVLSGGEKQMLTAAAS